MSKFVDFLVARDIYGVPVKVLYNGSDVYKTRMGSFCTMLTYALLLLNVILLTQGYLDGSKQVERSQT